MHHLSEVCVSFILLRASQFLSPWGWGEGFLGEHMARGGTRGGGGRISCRLKSIKRDYRKLTADGEGGRGRLMRILESLMGESGKFYLTQLKSSSMQQLPVLSQQLFLRLLVHFRWKWVNLSSPDAAFRTDPKNWRTKSRTLIQLSLSRL